MRLYVHTTSGASLGLDVQLTGQLEESDGQLRGVAVSLPTGCDQVVGYRIEALPKAPSGWALLWAAPADIWTDDGDCVSHDELHAEAARVRAKRRAELQDGPLGENYP